MQEPTPDREKPQATASRATGINARFRDRLPVITSEISDTIVNIEPDIDRAKVHVEEFLDFLDFEIQKARLAVERLAWADRVDRKLVEEASDWLEELEELRSQF